MNDWGRGFALWKRWHPSATRNWRNGMNAWTTRMKRWGKSLTGLVGELRKLRKSATPKQSTSTSDTWCTSKTTLLGCGIDPRGARACQSEAGLPKGHASRWSGKGLAEVAKYGDLREYPLRLHYAPYIAARDCLVSANIYHDATPPQSGQP